MHGSSEYSILMPKKSDRLVSIAARELADFLHQATGARLPVIQDPAKAARPDKLIRLEVTDKDTAVP